MSYVELLDLGDVVGLAKLSTRATVHTQGSAHELRGADAVTELIERGIWSLTIAAPGAGSTAISLTI